MAHRDRSGIRSRGPVPLPVKVVGRLAGALAVLSLLAFLAVVVLLIVAGAGGGRDVSDAPAGHVALDVALPVLAGAAILAILLALLNAIGVRPWFDRQSGKFVRPRSRGEWAIKLAGLVASLLLLGTLVSVGVAIALLAGSDADSDEGSEILIRVLVAGIGASLAVAGVVGGIVLMGWFGIVPGLMLGAGLIGVVVGPQDGVPAATVLGVVALGISVALFYGGSRFAGTLPDSVGVRAASVAFIAIAIGFLVLAAITHRLPFLVAGIAGVGATLGYAAGALLAHRRARSNTLR